MSLDVAKLEKVRELGGGIVQARCPACAEGGNDRSGEHLRIYPDGKFGCCVHPKDGDHRKRIWALVGVRQPGTFSLRLKTPPAMPSTRSVTAAFTSFNSRTPRTAKAELENSAPNIPTTLVVELRTGRTTELKLRARAREDSTTPNIDTGDFLVKLEDSESAVRAALIAGERLPFLTAGGDLSIPFDSPERYHWWRGGQSVAVTMQEVKERMNHAVIV